MYRFIAYDGDLNQYAILKDAPASSANDPHNVGLVTEDGRPVKRIDRGEYEIVDTKKKFRVWSDDPNGP